MCDILSFYNDAIRYEVIMFSNDSEVVSMVSSRGLSVTVRANKQRMVAEGTVTLV